MQVGDVDEERGVRCMHVALKNGAVIWRDDWNHYALHEGSVAVGSMENEKFAVTAFVAAGEWSLVFDAWSQGDHLPEFETAYVGPFGGERF